MKVGTGILKPGEDFWNRAKSRHTSFLIDGAAYYQKLAEIIRTARREIRIVGWDFDPDVLLTPDQEDSQKLATLIENQLEAEPGLHIWILVWAMGPLYSGKSLRLFRRKGILSHPRVNVTFDGRHHLFASHHQKLVSVDDRVGFIGGIDLTGGRWDDSRHLAQNDLRVKPGGDLYEPVHDLQVMVDGDAARAIGDLARRRWWHATGEALASPEQPAPDPITSLEASDLKDCEIALSLSEVGSRRSTTRHQSEAALTKFLRAARKHIYIEAQYLASFKVARVLAPLLLEKDGPEILVVVTRISHGFLEKIFMGENRDRLIRRLKRHDPHDRLRVMYAVVPEGEDGEAEVLIHSKLVIVDDCYLRIGSSNLNNRSEGLDSEADLLIEAQGEDQCRAIAGLRNRLLAEHLDARAEDLAASLAETGSLHEAVERHNVSRRGLRHFDVDVAHGAIDPVTGTAVVDPPAPLFSLGVVGVLGRVWSLIADTFLRRRAG